MVKIQNEINSIIKEIEVSESKYEQAVDSYNSIANYICESKLSCYSPTIKLQGSFKLGTAIKPLTDEASYDIDIVCCLSKLRVTDLSQFELKEKCGEIVAEYARSMNMKNDVKESRRCWTLNYVDVDNFHVDILPSIPLGENNDGLLAITDSTNINYKIITTDWETSNPQIYAEWFKKISNFDIYLQEYSLINRVGVEKVPEFKVRTPLQKIVQILKRHAEVYFFNNLEHKPSSIIITTLVAKQYANACQRYDNFLDVIKYIISNINDGLNFKNGKICVLNPVNLDEDLSIKWSEDNKYLDAYYSWIRQLRADFIIDNFEIDFPSQIKSIKRCLFIGEKEPLIDVSSLTHHKNPIWRMNIVEDVYIECSVTFHGFRSKKIKSGTPICKNCDLIFKAKGKNIKRYEIWWQITNTGNEALSKGCLRGDFYESELNEGKRVRKETTAYKGYHYAEVYLVKEGVCYGKSAPFEVVIVDGFDDSFLK